MNKIAGNPLFRTRLLANMPREIADSFTDLQIEMIENVVEIGKWGGHPVDIRLSIPVFWRHFYLVLLMGPERRSGERRAQEQAKHPIRTAANLLVFGLFLLLLVPAYVGTYLLLTMN